MQREERKERQERILKLIAAEVEDDNTKRNECS